MTLLPITPSAEDVNLAAPLAAIYGLLRDIGRRAVAGPSLEAVASGQKFAAGLAGPTAAAEDGYRARGSRNSPS